MGDETAQAPSKAYDPLILRQVRIRPSDVIVSTAPKAGTTWMCQLLHQLRTGGDEAFGSIYDVVPWLEFPGWPARSTDERAARYEALPDPRVFKSHLPRERCPGVGVAKHVVILRDPRDCAVSAYHHMADMSDAFLDDLGGTRPESFASLFERWLESEWFEHVAGWWPHRDDDRVLVLRFADLKSDLPAAIDRLARFLGWDVSADARAAAARLGSFDWMKANAERFKRFTAGGPLGWKPKGFLRGGSVGGHRATLSPEQERRVLATAAERLTPDCVAFLGLQA